MEISARMSELPSLQISPWRASIDQALLKSLMNMSELDLIAPTATVKSITEEQVEQYIR